ncbi:MAG: Bug family tripartite tricarboxylate transporter substrate binding protein [Burkholderiales bacterium]
MTNRIAVLGGLGALVASACIAPIAHAAYPEKPIRIILPYTAAGTGDFLIRAVQPGLQQQLGKPVIIDYRPGASGNIGTQEVIKSAPDGYTLLLGPTNNFVINQFLYRNMGFDPLQALAPIAMLADTPALILTNAANPARTFGEFSAYARANAGKLNYGSTGNASVAHLSGYRLSDAIGADMTHVPYNGTAPIVQALLANNVQMIIVSYGSTGPLIAAGKLRALAVASSERLKVLAAVPTTAEAGITPGLIPSGWWGIATVRGVDEAIILQLNRELRAVLATAELQKKYQDQGMNPVSISPAEFAERMAIEARGWRTVIDKSGARPDN